MIPAPNSRAEGKAPPAAPGAEAAPNLCLVIPVFNHALTVGRVVREAKALFPVIVVDDGSTDGTGAILAAEPGLTVVTLPRNQGKGAALRAGFERAEKLGFTHAITLDADGQHAVGEASRFAAASRRQPDAFIVGVRDLVREQAPLSRRVPNALSTFWFRVETGLPLADTQCGYRCYPLRALRRLRVRSQRYAYELEALVRGAWSGAELAAQPVSADYAAATSRLSHFKPGRDLARIALLHARLTLEAVCLPARLRAPAATGEPPRLSFRHKLKAVFRPHFSASSPAPE